MQEYDYIPLTTDDFRIAFCQATRPLCTDVQMRIWREVINYRDPPKCPDAPKKHQDRTTRLFRTN